MQPKQLTVENLRAIKGGDMELDVSTTIKVEAEGTVGPFTIKAEAETTIS